MTLWNIIRDFFVQYVFGGTDSVGVHWYKNDVGYADIFIDGSLDDTLMLDTSAIMFDIGGVNYDGNIYLSLGDWLSTTATIITLIGLFIAITMFIIKLVKWISNSIAMR